MVPVPDYACTYELQEEWSVMKPSCEQTLVLDKCTNTVALQNRYLCHPLSRL